MTGSIERDVLTVLPHREIDALAHGLHENVFSALGPHQISDESWEVRVLRPAAIAVDVVNVQIERIRLPNRLLALLRYVWMRRWRRSRVNGKQKAE